MIARQALATCARVACRSLLSTPIVFTRRSLRLAKMFSSISDSQTPDQVQTRDSRLIRDPDNELLKEEILMKEEPIYKSKIIQEVIKEPLLENKGGVEELQARPETPEKDKVFVQKKTTLWQKIKVALVHLKDSFVDVWKDTKYLSKMVYKNRLTEDNYTLFEMRERRRITKDLIKFMPYAVLIILPAGELLFPPYFLLFPNSTPTQFMTSANLGERTKILTEKQEQGYASLVKSLPKFAKLLGIDPIKLFESLDRLNKTEGKEKDRQFYKAHDFEDKLQKFLKLTNKEELISSIRLSNLDSCELEQLNKLFYQLYVPGYTWVNVLYGAIFKAPFYILKYSCKWLGVENPNRFLNNILVKFNFTLDHGPLSYLKKYLLLFQLKHHIKQIRKQDIALSKNFEQLANNPLLHKVEFARQRGINIDNQEDILKFVEYYWLPLSLRKDVSDDLLVWISILRYRYAEILI